VIMSPERRLLTVRTDEPTHEMRAPVRESIDALVAVTAELSSLPHWVSGGTALGLVRDGGIIPHDTDVDVCLLADWDDPPSHDLFPSVLRAIGAVPFRTTTYDGRPSQVAALRGNAIVDLYYCYENFEPGQLWMFAEVACIREPARLIYGRWWLNTPLGVFCLPQPCGEYFEHRYGPNWQTPEGIGGSWLASPARIPW
jgi:hypothetical protein